jgi:ferrous iron transport protein B
LSPVRPFTLALIGNPNAGKTSVFNRLTGLNQQVGNFPGVTVEKKSGRALLPNGETVLVSDLPGAYSLHPTSDDERTVLSTLLSKDPAVRPDAVLYVADITHLERHLLLCTQVLDLGYPLILGLSMSDVADSEGLRLDDEKLGAQLGVPVVRLNGRTGDGCDRVKALLAERNFRPAPAPFVRADELAPEPIRKAGERLQETNPYRALLWLHHLEVLGRQTGQGVGDLSDLTDPARFHSLPLQVEETMRRYDRLVPLVASVLRPSQGSEASDSRGISAKIDRVLTHKWWGTLFFLGILLLLFQAIFDWATYPMDWIENGISQLSVFFKKNLPAGWPTDLLTDGVLAGLSGVLVFVPQIAILFVLIALLEEVGYMARAVYLSDSLMRRFGLNGRSMVSLFSGMACAVPAIMAARSIGNSRERLITILVTPFVSCSARIPVYVLLVSFVLPEKSSIGPFNAQGLAMWGLYLLGVATALLAAGILKKILKTRDSGFLALELPAYKMPDWRNVAITVRNKVKVFVWEAGRIILALSVVLWFLSAFGPPGAFQRSEEELKAEWAARPDPVDSTEYEAALLGRRLQHSYLGYLGHAIEPVIRPLGFDWKIGIALISSFAAREVFVGTMATIYSVQSVDDEDPQTLRERMRDEITPRSALSLLLFYVFAMQCMSTLAVVRRETRSWKWPLIQLVAMTGTAYAAALVAQWV